MVVRDDVRAAPGADDRHLQELGEAGQLGRGPCAQDAGAGQDDRPPGRRQELDDGADLVVGRARLARPGRVRPDVVGHRLVEEILGQRQVGRSGSAAEGLTGRLGHGGRDLGRGVRLGGPLGEATEGRDLVDLLERLAAQPLPLDLADRHEHRGRILAGRVDPDAEVRPAHGTRPEADRGPAGQLAMGLGHERRATLVTRGDDPDPGALERVEQAQERFARDGERVAHAGRPQRIGDEPSDRPRSGVGHRLDRSGAAGSAGSAGSIASVASGASGASAAAALRHGVGRRPRSRQAQPRRARRSSSQTRDRAVARARPVGGASAAGGSSGGGVVSSSVMATALLRTVGPRIGEGISGSSRTATGPAGRARAGG